MLTSWWLKVDGFITYARGPNLFLNIAEIMTKLFITYFRSGKTCFWLLFFHPPSWLSANKIFVVKAVCTIDVLDRKVRVQINFETLKYVIIKIVLTCSVLDGNTLLHIAQVFWQLPFFITNEFCTIVFHNAGVIKTWAFHCWTSLTLALKKGYKVKGQSYILILTLCCDRSPQL